jgi:N-acetylmuramic acid 6-phosphate (MurNAc-6-P) etherase
MAAGNSVRTAIVMARAGVDRAEAERRLASVGGRISESLQQ